MDRVQAQPLVEAWGLAYHPTMPGLYASSALSFSGSQSTVPMYLRSLITCYKMSPKVNIS
eukprot:6138040-Amphidinium_carterae.5